MTRNILYLSIIISVLIGCDAKINNFESSNGSANFETVVFVGNSLTAGFRDNALYLSGQMESYPAIIHKQLYLGGLNLKEFKQPYMKDEAGFGNRRVLGYKTDCSGQTTLGPVLSDIPIDLSANMENISESGPFNNMGIPGARISHLFYSGYANLNPYFGRIAKETTSTIIGMVKAQNPTFIVTWIGNNDVLGFATSGGYNDSITSIGTFTQMINLIGNILYGGGTQGAVCNIPSITSAPFFTTIKPNSLQLTQEQADLLMFKYSGYNQNVQAYGFDSINFKAGQNLLVIQDLNPQLAPFGGLRQIKPNEMLLLTLPQDSLKCAGWGTSKPIPHYYVLDTAEIMAINNAITGYNSAISFMANERNLALVDMNSLLKEISDKGIRIGGQTFTTDFVNGQLFSLDGIHLTGRGYAVVANHIIKAINNKYGSTIPEATVNDYTGIIFP